MLTVLSLAVQHRSEIENASEAAEIGCLVYEKCNHPSNRNYGKSYFFYQDISGSVRKI